GPVEFPRFLDRPQIVTRKSQHRVGVSEFHRWAGSFSEDFLRVLAKNISMLLPADRVAAYPWTDHFSPTYRIQLTVEQFDGRFGEHVVLNVTWSVWNQKNVNEPVMKHTRIKEPVSAENYDALVAAQSRAIGTLSHAIVEEIKRVSQWMDTKE
ncbi:MAG: PqiC family protein, partial [Desulfobacterales bacterium]